MLAEFLLCMLLTSAFGAGSLYLLHREQESNASLAQTAAAIAQFERLHRAVNAADFAARALLVIRAADAEHVYRGRIADLDKELKHVLRHPTGIAEQRSVAELAREVANRFGNLEHVVQVRAADGVQRTRAAPDGFDPMRQINARIEQVKQLQSTVFEDIRQYHARTERDSRIMLAATALLSLGLIVTLCWRMDRLCSMLTRAQHEANHEAHHDALTGLPNARLLADRLSMALAHARRVGQMVAVVALDLEGFRQVNEEHGPNVADDVLQQTARRLQRLSRDADTVARIRDDEFVMVLSDVKSRDHAAAFAERLITNVSGSYTADGRDVSVGAHVGVSLFQGQAASADDLARQASAALWKAKNGGSRIEFVSNERP